MIRLHAHTPFLRRVVPAATFCAALAILAPLARGQDLDEYEYEPDEGLHEQEWYDPSDWFDRDDGVDFERDWWDDDSYDGYGFYDYGTYDYDLDGWYEYEPYGYEPFDDELFDVDELDYGYHWEWDADERRWVRSYGYYDDYYDFDPDPTAYDPYDEFREFDARSGRRETERERMTTRERTDTGRSERKTVTGRLEGVRRIELEGEREAHTLVRLRMQDGRTVVVDLGPAIDLTELELQRGDEVRIEGRSGRIDDEPVLFATRIRVADTDAAMERMRARPERGSERFRRDERGGRAFGPGGAERSFDRRGDAERNARARTMERAREHATLSGELQSFQRVELEGLRGEHTLVRLRLADGTTRLVAFGPAISVAELDMKPGEQVRIEGRPGRVDDQTVLFATRIRVGGVPTSMQAYRTERAPSGEPREAAAGRVDRRSADDVLARWPDASRKAARTMIQQYGEPDAVTPLVLVWKENGPWAATVVYRDPVPHDFPVPHEDVLEQFVGFDVPSERFDDLARFDGSVTCDRTKGLLSAACDQEAMNVLALNLAHDVILRERTVDEARQMLASIARRFREGQTHLLTERLSFETNPDAGDPGEPFGGAALGAGRSSGDSAQDAEHTRAARREDLRRQARGIAREAGASRSFSADEVVAEWPAPARKAAEDMLARYGEPVGVTPAFLVWEDTGPWAVSIVYRDAVAHDFPTPHEDVLEQFLRWDVPADLFDDLARYDGSIVCRRTKGLVSSFCAEEAMNFLALNLAQDIVTGQRTVEGARQQHAEAVRRFRAGEEQTLTRTLAFRTPRARGDRDEPAGTDERSERGTRER